MNQQLSEHSAGERQVLTFRLGEETYGIDILAVREIRAWSPVTRCPQSPPQVLGVLNLRGSVVPIIDLRVRFELDSATFTPSTVIIVLSIDTDEGPTDCGLVVDAVADVIDLEPEALRPAPKFASPASAGCIQALAAIGDRMIMLLSVEETVRHVVSVRGASSPPNPTFDLNETNFTELRG